MWHKLLGQTFSTLEESEPDAEPDVEERMICKQNTGVLTEAKANQKRSNRIVLKEDKATEHTKTQTPLTSNAESGGCLDADCTLEILSSRFSADEDPCPQSTPETVQPPSPIAPESLTQNLPVPSTKGKPATPLTPDLLSMPGVPGLEAFPGGQLSWDSTMGQDSDEDKRIQITETAHQLGLGGTFKTRVGKYDHGVRLRMQGEASSAGDSVEVAVQKRLARVKAVDRERQRIFGCVVESEVSNEIEHVVLVPGEQKVGSLPIIAMFGAPFYGGKFGSTEPAILGEGEVILLWNPRTEMGRLVFDRKTDRSDTGAKECWLWSPCVKSVKAGHYEFSAHFVAEFRELIERRLEASTQDAFYNFPERPKFGCSMELAALTDFMRSIELQYRNSQHQMRHCTLLVQPDVPFEQIDEFTSTLSMYTSEDARKAPEEPLENIQIGAIVYVRACWARTQIIRIMLALAAAAGFLILMSKIYPKRLDDAGHTTTAPW